MTPSVSAAQLKRCIHAFTAWPMSWLEIEGQPVKVGKRRSFIRQPTLHQERSLKPTNKAFRVATGDGILNLLSLQPAGTSHERARPPESLVGNGLSGQPSGLIVHSLSRSCRAFILRKNN
ncbi:hypothetical protein ACLK1T_15355 [Escherichia coli]